MKILYLAFRIAVLKVKQAFLTLKINRYAAYLRKHGGSEYIK